MTGIADLLLGLLWMYDVDATITIQEAAIYVGDSQKGETPHTVQGPKLVPCIKHFFILYLLRGVKTLQSRAVKGAHKLEILEDADDENSQNNSSEYDNIDNSSSGFH